VLAAQQTLHDVLDNAGLQLSSQCDKFRIVGPFNTSSSKHPPLPCASGLPHCVQVLQAGLHDSTDTCAAHFRLCFVHTTVYT